MTRTPPREELTVRGRASALRVADLVRSLDDTEAAAPVPGLAWSAIETAAHVVNLYGRALGDGRRSTTPEGTAELNATCLAEFSERDPVTVADRIASDAVTVWDEVFPALPGDVERPFHGGISSTLVPIMGVVLMEMLVHGDDIARATGRSWEVNDDDAWCALSAIAPLLAAWRRPGITAHDTIAIVGPAEDAFRVACDGDHVTVTVEPPHPDDRVVPERPSTALLGIFGRRQSTSPLADLPRRFGPF